MVLCSCLPQRQERDPSPEPRPYWKGLYGGRYRHLLGPGLEDIGANVPILFYGRAGSGSSTLIAQFIGCSPARLTTDTDANQFHRYDVPLNSGMELIQIPSRSKSFDHYARAALVAAHRYIYGTMPLKAFYFVIDVCTEHPLDILQELQFIYDIFGPLSIRCIRFVLNNWDEIQDDALLVDFQRELSRLYSLFLDNETLPLRQIIVVSSRYCIGQLIEDANGAWCAGNQVDGCIPMDEFDEDMFARMRHLYDAFNSVPTSTDQVDEWLHRFSLDDHQRRQMRDLVDAHVSGSGTAASVNSQLASMVVSNHPSDVLCFALIRVIWRLQHVNRNSGAKAVEIFDLDLSEFADLVLNVLPEYPTWIRSIVFEQIDEDHMAVAAQFAAYVTTVDDLLVALDRAQRHGIVKICIFIDHYYRAKPRIQRSDLDIVLRYASSLIFT